MLWNGGIGTYVKASTETHAEVGDRANDALRVNGVELRCKMVGEGGNLGLTQRGRIEYALAGGLINTDAIDNSAGVDCSDHEVNIKILLGDVIADDRHDASSERNELLASMTDEVGELVLDDNRAQTLALAIARRQALPMVNVHARYLNTLEAEGWLNRSLEFLPTDKQIAERQAAGVGPDDARVRRAAGVHEDHQHRADGRQRPARRSVPRARPRPLLPDAAAAAVPPTQIARHRLRREIIATQFGNQMVNISGISFDHRITEDTGVGVVDVDPRVGRGPRHLRHGGAVGPDRSARRRRAARRAARAVPRGAQDDRAWRVVDPAPPPPAGRHRRPWSPSSAAPMRALGVGTRRRAVAVAMRDTMFADEASRLAAGVPEQLAQRSALWPLLHTSFDVIELAQRRSIEPRTRRSHVLAGVRGARHRLAVGCDRRAAAQRPVADAGALGAARRPARSRWPT